MNQHQESLSLKFGFRSRFRVAVSTAEDGGMRITYDLYDIASRPYPDGRANGVDFLSDPQGRMLRRVLRIAARFGKPSTGTPVGRILLKTTTATGISISVLESGGRTALELSNDNESYILDTTEINAQSPLECFIMTLLLHFPEHSTS